MNEEMKQLVWFSKGEETERNSGLLKNLPVSRLTSQSVTMVTDPIVMLTVFLKLKTQNSPDLRVNKSFH